MSGPRSNDGAVTKSAEAPRLAGSGRLVAQIYGEGSVASQPLPQTGEVVIGRTKTADIYLDDPTVSRQHAILHMAATVRLEDLGSANGTQIGSRQLANKETAEIAVGDVIKIGNWTIVLQRQSRQRPRRLCSHGYFEMRVEDECTRAVDGATICAVIRVSAEEPLARTVLAEHLRSIDIVGIYSPGGELEILLVDTSLEDAQEMERRLEEAFAASGAAARLGMAIFGQPARTPEGLIAQACHRVRGHEESTEKTDDILIGDPKLQEIHRLVDRVAVGTISVLLLGETGVGKEVIAAALHRKSKRASGPFLQLNCAALSETLLESELFGHERGAFTGAVRAKQGLLEAATGGTVFLDEIGDMPLSLQTKLLRVFEDRNVMRVGSVKARPIDVRFVAATNRDLESEARNGIFRRDLFFRLAGATILIPPLRERPTEIAELAQLFIRQVCAHDQLGRPPELAADAVEQLLQYPWPGNIRELRNMMERAVLLCGPGPITTSHLPHEKMADPSRVRSAPRVLDDEPTVPADTGSAPAEPVEQTGDTLVAPVPLRERLNEAEKQAILEALAETGGNQTRAAKLLGISRRKLITRLDAYGIRRPRKK